MNNNNTTAIVKNTLKTMINEGLITSCKKNGEELFRLTEKGEACAKNPRIYAASKASVTKSTVKVNSMVKAHNYACGAQKAALTRKRRAAARKAAATRKANQQKALLTR